jgi:hypothetical protein
MAKISGKPVSELVRMALLGQEKDFTKEYNESYNRGMNNWALWHYCSVCGQAITIIPNSDAHKAIIEYMTKFGWAHPNCLKQ